MNKKIKLNRKEKNAVKKWFLGLSEYGFKDCPFYELRRDFTDLSFCSSVCRDWFPRTQINDDCPCDVYSLNYVLRRAKQMIKND